MALDNDNASKYNQTPIRPSVAGQTPQGAWQLERLGNLHRWSCLQCRLDDTVVVVVACRFSI